MGLIDTYRQRSNARTSMREAQDEAVRWRSQAQLMEASMLDLELQIRDEGWIRMTNRLELEFTRPGLDELMEVSNAMYLSNPLVQRAVNVRGYYTFAQGMSIQAREEVAQERIVAPFIDEHGNQVTLFSQQARLLTDVDQHCDGNTFLALFTAVTDGRVRVRDVPARQIREIITSPDDATEVWFYRRRWIERRFEVATGEVVATSREALYPDINYQPRIKLPAAGGIEIRWDAPLIHLRTGGRKSMLFGLPETYAALDWARAYQKFLQDWHTIVASLARFAWRVSVRGSKIRRTRERFRSSLSEEEPVETNPTGPAGSVFVGTENDRIDPINRTGATTSAEDGRPSRLMVGAAMDLPDTILSGDADVGNHATASSLDRPTELMFRSRQTLWGDHTSAILHYTYEQAIRHGAARDEDPGINVSFPPILEHDVEATVSALVSAATLDGKIEAGTMPRETLVRLLMQAVGVENVDDEIKKLDDEEQQQLATAVESLARLLAEQRP